jgi:presenilin enhancer 2
MDPTEDIMDSNTKIDVAKKMFYGGFLFLPWLWIVNYLLFRKDLTRQSTPEAVKWLSSF